MWCVPFRFSPLLTVFYRFWEQHFREHNHADHCKGNVDFQGSEAHGVANDSDRIGSVGIHEENVRSITNPWQNQIESSFLCGDVEQEDVQDIATEYSNLLRAGDEGVPHYISKYEKEGKPRFDVVILGVGADGSCAGFHPNSAALLEHTATCVPVPDAPGGARVSLSVPILSNAKHVCFVATGEDKAEVLGRLIPVGDDCSKQPPGLVAAVDGWEAVDALFAARGGNEATAAAAATLKGGASAPLAALDATRAAEGTGGGGGEAKAGEEEGAASTPEEGAAKEGVAVEGGEGGEKGADVEGDATSGEVEGEKASKEEGDAAINDEGDTGGADAKDAEAEAALKNDAPVSEGEAAANQTKDGTEDKEGEKEDKEGGNEEEGDAVTESGLDGDAGVVAGGGKDGEKAANGDGARPASSMKNVSFSPSTRSLNSDGACEGESKEEGEEVEEGGVDFNMGVADIPAAWIYPANGDVHWFIDEAAGKRLPDFRVSKR